MKNLIYIIAVGLALGACQEEIDLPLKNGEPRYVVVAQLNAGDSLARVQVSKSIGISETNDFPMVSGAFVEITDDLGNGFQLTEDTPGEYIIPFEVEEEREYTLIVQHDETTFTAKNETPNFISLDSIGYVENSGFGQGGQLLVPYFKDDASTTDYYAFQYFMISDTTIEPMSGIILRDDELTNGQVSEQPLFEAFPVESGMVIYLQMYMITEAEYVYRFSKSQNTSPDSGAPADPVTNLSNNALGYFAVRGYQDTTFLVP